MPGRRTLLVAGAGLLAGGRLRAAAAGPWVLVEDGQALLQLHPDTLQPLQRWPLPQRWVGLWPAAGQPLGRGGDGALLRHDRSVPVVQTTGPVTTSADGDWVCAVEADGLHLRDAALALRRRWPLPDTVAWLADLPRRRAFVLAFAARPELWQLSYDERAEDFYDGLVHDHRFGEGVPTRAYLNVRRMPLPEPLLDASADASQSELAGRGWVFNLDARRRARLLPRLQPPGPGCAASLAVQGRPAVLVPVRDQPWLDLWRTDDWAPLARIALPQPAERVWSHPALDAVVVRAGARPWVVLPASGQVQPLPGVQRFAAAPGGLRWRDDGGQAWLLADDALCAVDTRSWRLRQVQALDRPVALA